MAGEPEVPREAAAIASLLKSVGVENYEANVVHMTIDLMREHVTDLLLSARIAADHAGKADIDIEDLKLAAETRESSVGPLDRSSMALLARTRNAIPLPVQAPVSMASGLNEVPLPPLTQRLLPQVNVEIEDMDHQPNSLPKASTPWTITPSEEQFVQEHMLLRRRMANAQSLAARNAATSMKSASTLTNVAVKVRTPGTDSQPQRNMAAPTTAYQSEQKLDVKPSATTPKAKLTPVTANITPGSAPLLSMAPSTPSRVGESPLDNAVTPMQAERPERTLAAPTSLRRQGGNPTSRKLP